MKEECQTINVPKCRNESTEVFIQSSEYQCNTELQSECKDVIIENCQEKWEMVDFIDHKMECKEINQNFPVVTQYRDEIITTTNSFVVKGSNPKPPKENCVRTFEPSVCMYTNKTTCYKTTAKVILISIINQIIIYCMQISTKR